MIKNCLSHRRAFVIIIGILLVAMQNAEARLYRWENEKGEVIYSDTIPPEEADLKKEALKKSGKVAEVIEAAKTKEQWELEKRIEALRKEQEKIIAKHKSEDKVLLSTFRSEHDIRMMLKNMLDSIGGQQKATENNLLRLQQQLQSLQREAAKYERQGTAVPKELLDNVADTNRQISETNNEIARHIQKKADVTKEFEAHIARFNFLTQPDADAQKISTDYAENIAANVLGLVGCISMDQCARVWQKARIFVQQYSTKPIDINTDRLIMSGEPRKSDDLSLSVSRMDRPGRETQIFLDIRCQKSSLGEQLCASSKVREIRTAFRPFVTTDSAPQQ